MLTTPQHLTPVCISDPAAGQALRSVGGQEQGVALLRGPVPSPPRAPLRGTVSQIAETHACQSIFSFPDAYQSKSYMLP